jgi:hypothetical protein
MYQEYTAMAKRSLPDKGASRPTYSALKARVQAQGHKLLTSNEYDNANEPGLYVFDPATDQIVVWSTGHGHADDVDEVEGWLVKRATDAATASISVATANWRARGRAQPLFSFLRTSDDDEPGKYQMMLAPDGEATLADHVFAIAAIGEAMEVCEGDNDTVMGLAGALKVIGAGLHECLAGVNVDDESVIQDAFMKRDES